MSFSKISRIFDDINLSYSFHDVAIEVPLSYQKRYQYCKVTFNKDESFLMVKEARSGSLKSFIQQANYLGNKVDLPVILVFSSVAHEDKLLLVRSNIPFIDDSGNMYLPYLGLVFHNTKAKLELHQTFTPNEQLVLIALLFADSHSINISNLNQTTKVAVPTIYRALKGFVARGWLASVHGQYDYQLPREQIYQEAKAFFINPIKSIRFISQETLTSLKTHDLPIRIAGTKALGALTMLVEAQEVYAVKNSDFNKKAMPIIEKVHDDIELQLWKYAPLAYCGNIIDPISLSLSLLGSSDPRINQEVSRLETVIIEKLKEINDAHKH